MLGAGLKSIDVFGSWEWYGDSITYKTPLGLWVISWQTATIRNWGLGPVCADETLCNE